MSQSNLLQVLLQVERNLLQGKGGRFREEVADVAPHIFTINAKQITEDIRQQFLQSYGGARGSSTKLPKTIEDTIKREVPLFTKRLYNAFDPERTRRIYGFSDRIGNSDNFTVRVYLKQTGGSTKRSVFRVLRDTKRRAQGPLIKALNKALRSIGRDQEIDKQSFLDLGHEKGVAIERAEVALHEIGEALQDINLRKEPKEFVRVVNNLKSLGIRLGLSSKWPKDNKEFTISIFLEGASVNRRKGATTEKELIDKLGLELKEAVEKLEGWATQKSSDDYITYVKKTIIQEFNKAPVGKKSFDSKLLKKANKKSSRATRRVKKPKVTPVAVVDSIVDLSKVERVKGNKASGADSLLRLHGLLSASINDEVAKNMNPPSLVNRTGRFAGSVKITDVSTTRQGFPSIGYTYDKNPYQVFEMSRGRAPWATPERDPRHIIETSIRNIARELLLGRFFTRRI